MGVLSVEDGKIFPAAPGRVKALQLVDDPSGLLSRTFQCNDAYFFTFILVRLQELFWKFRAHLVHRNGLGGHAKNVGCRAVVFREGDTEGRGVLTLFPIGETLEKKFETAEGSAAETVDGLVVVTDNHDVAGIRTEQMKQFQLRDVGVLKFVNQDVLEALLEVVAFSGVAL